MQLADEFIMYRNKQLYQEVCMEIRVIPMQSPDYLVKVPVFLYHQS